MDRIAARLSESKLPLAVLVLMCADVLALAGAVLVSLALRFDGIPFAQVFRVYVIPHALSLALAVPLYLASLYAFHLYRYAWRFASLEIVWQVMCATFVGLVGLISLQALLESQTLPRSVLIIFWLMSVTLVGGVRVLLRLANLGRSYGRRTLRLLRGDTRPKRVVILGGGADGARLLTALREDQHSSYDILGFLDDTPYRRGIYIRGARVIGPFSHLYDLLANREVDEVLIAITDASGDEIRDYVMACRKKQVPVKVIPALKDVLSGRAQARLEDISVEDLLRRQPVRLDGAQGSYLQDKRVLVTGAGGSIGSELCRQIIAQEPAALVLLGHGENSLHQIYGELLRSHPQLADRLCVAVASVSDAVRVDQVFAAHRPHVVFHAAAHKHVPMMEVNVCEAVQNNVMGTRCVAQACGHYGVERMVLISTDKAVYPSSVMGATKWLCEQVGRTLASVYPETTYVTVRFGNVLGSRGSVVPLFKEQIKRGGPVTITHPQVTRYFMTIPEAVQLVLQAGAVGESGELYLLDMGKPIRILDLASDMIRLSGLEPERDVPIIFTGLRPGEKLQEHLISKDELQAPAGFEGLSVVHRPEYYPPAEFGDVLRRLQQLADAGDPVEVLNYLGEVVPSFASQRLLSESLSTPDPHEIGQPS